MAPVWHPLRHDRSCADVPGLPRHDRLHPHVPPGRDREVRAGPGVRVPAGGRGEPRVSPVVVPIALGHAASFRQALDVVAREKRYLAMTEAPSLEQVQAFVRQNLERGVAQVVALDGERVVGWADIVPPAHPGLAHRGTLGMGVVPGFRARGLGRALLAACIERAWAAGLSRIELEVRADNLPAIGLYVAMGFRHEGYKPRGICLDGAFLDTLAMGLLREGA